MQCAISTYKTLMDATKGKNLLTCNLALPILSQEVEHEEDPQCLKEDLELMVKRDGTGKWSDALTGKRFTPR